ncbi:XPA protein C-terminus [Pseudobutyrivibrio sp. ACV-2]|uniref:hypothetical protein n=1 Tax=Pseudobutyrivibrio sp. ACV-2 TaxID=1520801 RepID=UPI000894A66A|nr:hypothetical protein [Pseudobutyrivibrio sp. ACV-2]SEB04542.1 XPA protein C-terminus [Pseudobutyrivibrio sp. ACV-2]
MSNKKQNKTDEPELITKSTVKSEYGFNEKMIDTLLPEPILKTNPRYHSAAPMQLFNKEDVLKAMETDEYKDMHAKHLKRSKTATEVAERKRQETQASVKEIIDSITIPNIPLDDIYEEACECGLAHMEEKAFNRGDFDFNIYDYSNVDDKTRDRWAVNFIRHELTNYDYYLHKLEGKVGKEDAYIQLNQTIFDKIVSLYPALKSACEDQRNRMFTRIANSHLR